MSCKNQAPDNDLAHTSSGIPIQNLSSDPEYKVLMHLLSDLDKCLGNSMGERERSQHFRTQAELLEYLGVFFIPPIHEVGLEGIPAGYDSPQHLCFDWMEAGAFVYCEGYVVDKKGEVVPHTWLLDMAHGVVIDPWKNSHSAEVYYGIGWDYELVRNRFDETQQFGILSKGILAGDPLLEKKAVQARIAHNRFRFDR